MRKAIAVACTTAAIAVGVGAGAAPAGAHQNGLVNVDISNVLNNNNVTVQIPINAAANICGVSVAVLSLGPNPGDTVSCVARSGHQLTITRL